VGPRGLHAEQKLVDYLEEHPEGRVLVFSTSNAVCAPCRQEIAERTGLQLEPGSRGWVDPAVPVDFRRAKEDASGEPCEEGFGAGTSPGLGIGPNRFGGRE
jgi:hypothetical protein